MKYVAQRGCGDSVLRFAENQTGHGPEQPALSWARLSIWYIFLMRHSKALLMIKGQSCSLSPLSALILFSARVEKSVERALLRGSCWWWPSAVIAQVWWKLESFLTPQSPEGKEQWWWGAITCSPSFLVGEHSPGPHHNRAHLVWKKKFFPGLQTLHLCCMDFSCSACSSLSEVGFWMSLCPAVLQFFLSWLLNCFFYREQCLQNQDVKKKTKKKTFIKTLR